MAQRIGFYQKLRVAARMRKEGYSIVRYHYLCRYGKIDLIAERDGMVCFVKILHADISRVGNNDSFFNQDERDALKQTAAFFMSSNESILPYRIDLAVLHTEQKVRAPLYMDYWEDFLRGEKT